MNNLHLHAVRRHAANTFRRRKASNGASSRSYRAVAVSMPRGDAALPLRAQWFRHPLSGALECRWVPLETARRAHPRQIARIPSMIRMHRRARRVSMRPPLCKHGHG
ncbi:hypothetical protein [Dyella silvatica]|uniref:hypothetical protein n=1 Tax=Dyella silvatica TaxID=2992128 RepID=UPI0022571945|nr:hypothetical protein [Dyella silvatica]